MAQHKRGSSIVSPSQTDKLLESNQDITISLSWQFVEHPIDLDVSLVIYDKNAAELKALYFNERQAFDDLFLHSGDNRDGMNRDSSDPNKWHKELETIAINLSKLSNLAENDIDDGILDTIHAIFVVVNVHESETQGSFRDIEAGKIQIFSGNDRIFKRNLECSKYAKDSKYSSLLVGCIYKVDDEATVESYKTEWRFATFEKLGFGKTFDEIGLIDDDILMHVYNHDSDLIDFRPNTRDVKYNLNKGQRYIFHSTLEKINVGLSWESSDSSDSSSKAIDMDCSVILLDSNKKDICHVDKLNKSYKFQGKTVCQHLGDNKTGHSSNNGGNNISDDETIKINLDACSANKCPVHTFAAYININSGAKSFKEVKNCFVKIYDPKNSQELCEIQVSDFPTENGLIVYNITQISKTGLWQLFTKAVAIKKDQDPYDAILEDLGGAEDAAKADEIDPQDEVKTLKKNGNNGRTNNTDDANDQSRDGCCAIL